MICDALLRQAELMPAAENGRAPRVAAYAPLRSEVDVMPFAEAAYERGWEVCFPCMVRSRDANVRMAFLLVSHRRFERAQATFLKAPTHSFAISDLETDGFEPIDPRSLDFVVVPLVAFDPSGNRLGYGGGNYDRMLPRLRSDAVVVGAAFDEQRVAAIPVEPHDRPLPLVLSA